VCYVRNRAVRRRLKLPALHAPRGDPDPPVPPQLR
jgi:hypothetical protein